MNKKCVKVMCAALVVLTLTSCKMPGKGKMIDAPVKNEKSDVKVAEEKKEVKQSNNPILLGDINGTLLSVESGPTEIKVKGLEDGTRITIGSQSVKNFGPGKINELQLGGDKGATKIQMDKIQPLRIDTVGATTEKVTIVADQGFEIVQASANTLSSCELVPDNYVVTYSAGGPMTNTVAKYENMSDIFPSKLTISSSSATKLGLELGYDYAVVNGNLNGSVISTYNRKTNEESSYQIETKSDSVLLKADNDGNIVAFRTDKKPVPLEEQDDGIYSKMTGIKISDYSSSVIAKKIV